MYINEKQKEEILADVLELLQKRSNVFEDGYINVDALEKQIKTIEARYMTQEVYERIKPKRWPKRMKDLPQRLSQDMRTRFEVYISGENEEYNQLRDTLKKVDKVFSRAASSAVELFLEEGGYMDPDSPVMDQFMKEADCPLEMYLETADYTEDIIDDDSILDYFDWDEDPEKNRSVQEAIQKYLKNPASIYTDALLTGYIDTQSLTEKFWNMAEEDWMCIFSAVLGENGAVQLEREEIEGSLFDYWDMPIGQRLEQDAKHMKRAIILKCMKNNLDVRKELEQMNLEKSAVSRLRQMGNANFHKLFTQARSMHRKCILHAGPTNSGKTWKALQALEKAEHGVYLGPLRLLAYEVFQSLNDKGIPASLLTGEEEIQTPHASIVCSTCEMADYQKHYDIAVIDEAQMIGDENRGGSWTNAILGLQADEIHICCTQESVSLIQQLIGLCQDEVQVEIHERLTPIVWTPCPSQYQKGDAFIVFSRKNAHALAGELKNAGHTVSLIYGAMPYDVRHHEAKRFAQGRTDLLVATDAIGMGMNLPIGRVFLMETRKYDGKTIRDLHTEEIRQIAGRAGRFGIYSIGYFGSLYDSNTVKSAFETEVPALKRARIGFPVPFSQLDARASTLLIEWQSMRPGAPYSRQNMDYLISRAIWLEEECDDKDLVWTLLSVSCPETSEEFLDFWKERCAEFIQTGQITVPSCLLELKEEADLAQMETKYALLDMCYQFACKAGNDEQKKVISETRQELSLCMMTILESSYREFKRCSSCHEILPWNSSYSMCTSCYESMREARRWARSLYYPDFDDDYDLDDDDDFNYPF